MPADAGARISIVVSAFDARASIGPCLDSLLGGSYGGDFDVTVVDSSTDGTADLVAERYPQVRLVRAAGLYPGEARNLGLANTDGEIMTFLDGNCVPARNLLEEIANVHRGPHPAVGGVIANGDPNRLGWPSYFCKLATWMPRSGGPQRVGDLPSECLSVKRSAFEAWGNFPEGTYSSATAFSWRLNERGEPAWLNPAMQVSRIEGPSFGPFMRVEPVHGRYFARVRAREEGFSRPRMLAQAALAPAVPFVLFARSATSVLRNRRYVARFAINAPLVFLGYCAWAYGEVRGYLSRA